MVTEVLHQGIKAETLKLGRKCVQPFLLDVPRGSDTLKVLVFSPWCQGPQAQGRGEAHVVLEEQRVGEEENQPWRYLTAQHWSLSLPVTTVIPVRVKFPFPFTELVYSHKDWDNTLTQEKKKSLLWAIKISTPLPCFNLSCIRRKPSAFCSHVSIFLCH